MIEPNDVKEHYGAEPLLACIDEALRRAGLGDRSLGWADLVPLDQFHVRGLGATRELAESLGIDAGANVLDVGCGLGGPARFLAATYGCHVTGIDLSQPFRRRRPNAHGTGRIVGHGDLPPCGRPRPAIRR
jgi:MPBQ/MSBQ methyltransferase